MTRKIDYKKELEEAARSMILIHEPHTLIRMIVRMIVRKVSVKHAGILLYDKAKDSYILTVSRGEAGLKIPTGFLHLKKESPLVRLFAEKNKIDLKSGILASDDINHLLWKTSLFGQDAALRDLIVQAKEQLERFRTFICIPSYFHDRLVGLLLLGEKTSGEKFYQPEIDFFNALASDVAMAVRNAELFQDLQSESKRAHDLFINTTIAFIAAVEAKDLYTRGHTERVANLSMAIAKRLVDEGRFLQKDMENLHLAALLHDIGKIGIPEQILNKVEPLTEEEMVVIRRHPSKGVEILSPIKELKASLEGIKYHHERYDGKGYPEGIKGKEIPLIAAIIAVVDSLDAMTTDRPYRKALVLDAAVEELRRCSGSQFNPVIVDTVLRLYREGSLAIQNNKLTPRVSIQLLLPQPLAHP